MSALQIIEEIRALPAEEQEKIVSFVRSLESTDGRGQVVRYMDTNEAITLSAKIFDENAELFRKLAQ